MDSWIESLLFLCTKVARWLCYAVPYRAVQCFAVPITCAISMFFTSFSLLSVRSLSPFQWVYWIVLMFENWQTIRWGKWIQPYCCCRTNSSHTYIIISPLYIAIKSQIRNLVFVEFKILSTTKLHAVPEIQILTESMVLIQFGHNLSLNWCCSQCLFMLCCYCYCYVFFFLSCRMYPDTRKKNS